MDQTTLLITIFGGIFVFVVFLVIVVRRYAKKKTAEWLQTAKALGLAPSGQFPRLAMAGAIGGTTVGLVHQSKTTRRNGKSHTTTWAEALAHIPGGTGDLTVAEEGVFSRLGTLVGGTDHKTGDAAFDKKFLVKGSAQNAAYLTAPARAALLGLEQSIRGEVTVSEGAVRWKGSSVSAETAGKLLQALSATAQSFRAQG